MMSRITNTTAQAKEDPLSVLGPALLLGSKAIEMQERQGQVELMQSESLPSNLEGLEWSVLERWGFTLGEPYSDDPLFRPATLPAGWSMTEGDNPYGYWTFVKDHKGRTRLAVFYKSAFYDRKAHMHGQTRFRLEPEYEEYRSTGRAFVMDGEVIIHTTGSREFVPTDSDPALAADHAGEQALKEAQAWLEQRHPDWRNPAAYWEDEP